MGEGCEVQEGKVSAEPGRQSGGAANERLAVTRGVDNRHIGIQQMRHHGDLIRSYHDQDQSPRERGKYVARNKVPVPPSMKWELLMPVIVRGLKAIGRAVDPKRTSTIDKFMYCGSRL